MMLERGLGATVERAVITSRWMSSTVPASERGLGALGPWGGAGAGGPVLA